MEETEDFQIKEFATLCRLCSITTTDQKKVDLFSATDDKLIDKIFDCTKIRIKISDVLPICICLQCFERVRNFHEFQKQCVQTQQNLNNKISTLKNRTKFKEENEEFSSGFLPLDIVVKLEEGGENTVGPLNLDEDDFDVDDDDDDDDEDRADVKEESAAEGSNDEDNCHSGSESSDDKVVATKKKKLSPKKLKPSAKVDKEEKGDKVEKVKRKPMTKEERKERMRAKYKTYLRPCDICGQMIHKFRMQYHINTHNGVTPFKCDGDEECTRAFSCPYMLAVHKRDHHMHRVFTCELCGKSYTVQNSLRNHKQREHMAPKYECSVCGRKYKTSTYLKQHFRTHTGERPYLCSHDGCTKSFAKSYNLKIHIRSHTKEKPCKCPVEGCGNSYGYNCLLKAHIDKIHPHLSANANANGTLPPNVNEDQLHPQQSPQPLHLQQQLQMQQALKTE